MMRYTMPVTALPGLTRRSGLGVRTIRVSREQAQKLVELGYHFLESKGDPQKEGIAVEAYLGDNL